jgi:rRNA maturation endonuclease Nob1
LVVADYEFVCNECGRRFHGMTPRIGEEMCPECGSIDLVRVGESSAGEGATAPSPDDTAPTV